MFQIGVGLNYPDNYLLQSLSICYKASSKHLLFQSRPFKGWFLVLKPLVRYRGDAAFLIGVRPGNPCATCILSATPVALYYIWKLLGRWSKLILMTIVSRFAVSRLFAQKTVNFTIVVELQTREIREVYRNGGGRKFVGVEVGAWRTNIDKDKWHSLQPHHYTTSINRAAESSSDCSWVAMQKRQTEPALDRHLTRLPDWIQPCKATNQRGLKLDNLQLNDSLLRSFHCTIHF